MATQESRRQRPTVEDQNLSLQTDELTAAGCEKIYMEKISGAKSERPELARLRDSARPGDTVTVWKLDRLGRSLKHLIATVNHFSQSGVGFRSLKENIDTTTATGKLVFHKFASFAEFDRTAGTVVKVKFCIRIFSISLDYK